MFLFIELRSILQTITDFRLPLITRNRTYVHRCSSCEKLPRCSFDQCFLLHSYRLIQNEEKAKLFKYHRCTNSYLPDLLVDLMTANQ